MFEASQYFGQAWASYLYILLFQSSRITVMSEENLGGVHWKLSLVVCVSGIFTIPFVPDININAILSPEIAGVWWFYIPEAYAGFPHLGGWPKPGEHFTFHRLFYFYFGFWLLGGTWVVVFSIVIAHAFGEISAIVAQHDSKKLA
jgi:hypothetical protein